MNIGTIRTNYEFSGAARAAQRSGSTASLVRELGDNYRTYHDRLVADLEAAGGRPVPSAFATPDAYFEAYARVQAIVTAEALLRICRGYRLEGRSLNSELDAAIPLVDRNDRLVDVTNPKSSTV